MIDLLGRLRGGLDETRRAELLERFELDPTKKGRAYSKGNRQKVALVAALAADVELLVLDEPTSGLDPLMEAVFQQCIDEFRERGRHGAALQPHPGRGRAALRPGEHHPGRPHRRVRHARRAAPPDPHVGLGRAGHATPPGWTALDGVHDLVVEGDRVRFEVDTEHLGAALERSGGSASARLTSQPPTLEELFLRHYGDELSRAQTGGAGGMTGSAPSCCASTCGATAGCCSGGCSARSSSTGRRRSASRGSTRRRPSSTRPRRAWPTTRRSSPWPARPARSTRSAARSRGRPRRSARSSPA